MSASVMEAFDVDLFQGTQARGSRFVDDFNQLRETAPVFYSPGSQAWILTRYQDVADMMMGKFPLQNGGREAFIFQAIPEAEWQARIPNLVTQVPLWIVSTDTDKHARLRRMLMAAFNRKIVDAAREYARFRAGELLDQALNEKGGVVEFNEQFGRAMAGYVLFKLIGMPEEVFPKLKDWATWVMECFGGAGIPSAEKLERAEKAFAAMNAVVKTELEKRRVEPRDDLITTLLQASEAEGEQALTLDEIYAQMHVIIIAGHDTTANTMTLGVEALSRHPEALDYIRQHPDEIAECVAEIQRYVAMSAGQMKFATTDFELHGQTIKAGQMVLGAIMAADRDPLKFDNPEGMDLSRDNREMLVFAPGPRSCIGHLLAKMQLSEFFGQLAQRVEKIEVLDDELAWMPVFVFRGLYNLNVRLTPRQLG